jgi:Tfp pilus assembly protein PilN
MTIPEINWEWKISPGTIIGAVQLLAIVIAIGGGFIKMQADLNAQQLTIAKLESLIASVREVQIGQNERVTRVETKVDIILPTLMRIESRQLAREYIPPP